MIKFNQPRYILPLIILPFIYIFYFLFHSDSLGSPSHQMVLEAIEGINPSIPAPILDRVAQKDKFGAYLIAHKNKRDFSAMQEIDNRTEKELISTDSVPDTSPQIPDISPSTHGSKPRGPVHRDEYDPKSLSSLPSSEYPTKPPNEDYMNQMELFKAQMLFMDSLFYGESGNEEKGLSEDGEIGKRDEEEMGRRGNEDFEGDVVDPDTSSETLPVEKRHGIRSAHFNTIVKDPLSLFIHAIIDEEIKVEKDSRIRIRLLEDVMVGGVVIPKNQCLYGIVSSFSPQRVEIRISSVIIDGIIQDISLEVYDLDGLKGLYVPESTFRDVTKSLGSDIVRNPAMSINQSPDNAMQLVYGMAKDAVQTSTQAAAKALKNNKATIKYSTLIYLVNSSKP